MFEPDPGVPALGPICVWSQPCATFPRDHVACATYGKSAVVVPPMDPTATHGPARPTHESRAIRVEHSRTGGVGENAEAGARSGGSRVRHAPGVAGRCLCAETLPRNLGLV